MTDGIELTRNTKNRRFDEERGQAMVELAIVLPIFLMLVFGIIQFAIVFNHYQTLTDAVRVGARQAAISRNLSNPTAVTEARLRKAAQASLQDSDLAVEVDSSWAQGSDVTVRASYPYEINIIGVVVKSGRLKSETTERVE